MRRLRTLNGVIHWKKFLAYFPLRVFFPIKLETGKLVSFVGGQRWTSLNNGNASGNRAFKKRNEQDCSSTANENASCWMNFFSHRKNIIGIRIFLPNNGKLFCVATSILIKLHLLYQQFRWMKGIYFFFFDHYATRKLWSNEIAMRFFHESVAFLYRRIMSC